MTDELAYYLLLVSWDSRGHYKDTNVRVNTMTILMEESFMIMEIEKLPKIQKQELI